MAISSRVNRTIIAAGVVSLLAFLLVRVTAPEHYLPHSPGMVLAVPFMRSTVTAMGEHREAVGPPIDEGLDPNRTGLIGPQYSPLFTSVGHLAAKRTTTGPDMAALIVHLLEQAGVGAGDKIAIGASGSFPALMVASLVACKMMELRPSLVFSLGASSYGATEVDFNMLDIYELLSGAGFPAAEVAVSLGGGDDIGREFDPEVRERLIAQIEASGMQLIQEPDLRRNVAERMAFYGEVAAFINIGGSDANLGSSPMVLELEPGLNVGIDLPPEEQRGVLFEMAGRGVPVIHLLNIRGLASRYGIPWDPVPLPQSGQTYLIDTRETGGKAPGLIALGYFLALIAILFLGLRRPGAVPDER